MGCSKDVIAQSKGRSISLFLFQKCLEIKLCKFVTIQWLVDGIAMLEEELELLSTDDMHQTNL